MLNFSMISVEGLAMANRLSVILWAEYELDINKISDWISLIQILENKNGKQMISVNYLLNTFM